MPFDRFRIGHAGAVFNPAHKKRAAPCGSSFYKSPSVGQQVNSLEPLTITWDPSCLDAKLIDIYLLAPGSEYPRMHIYQKIVNTEGTYNAELKPRWWNSTSSMMLQIGIIDADKPLFLSKLPSGPTFTATYTEPATGKPESADNSKPLTESDGYTDVSLAIGASSSSSHLSKGKIAAAVIMPLLIAIVAILAYMRWARSKGKEKRKRWSEALDKRMSTISTDWKSMSAAGANAAIRNSMAVGENGAANRNSSFSFGAIRPSSTVGDGGHAGVGARSLYQNSNSGIQMSQSSLNTQVSHIRPGLRQSAFENRVSRVSFAADTRPSGESRRTRHIPSEYIPPVPTVQTSPNARTNSPYRPGSSFVNGDRESSYYEENSGDSYVVDDVGSMSPRQAFGAPPLSADDIRSRIDGAKGRRSFDEVLPALSLMRTDGHKNDEGSYIYSPPSPPLPTHAKTMTSPSSSAGITSPDYYNGAPANPAQYVNAPASATLFSSSPLSPGYPLPVSPPSAASPSSSSPFNASFGMQSFGGMMQPMPASVMSPDEMLRAYAARSAAAAGGHSTAMSPPPTSSAASTPSTAGNRMSSYLGNGTGFGAAVTPGAPAAPYIAAAPTGTGNRRSLTPAGPGAISASRGAYGVSYDEKQEWGTAQ